MDSGCPEIVSPFALHAADPENGLNDQWDVLPWIGRKPLPDGSHREKCSMDGMDLERSKECGAVTFWFTCDTTTYAQISATASVSSPAHDSGGYDDSFWVLWNFRATTPGDNTRESRALTLHFLCASPSD